MTVTAGEVTAGPEVPPLTAEQKAESVAWVLIIGHLVRWAVDAVYYIGTQVSVAVTAPGGQPYRIWGWKDAWDRAPVHLANIVHYHVSQVAPQWWVTWRHDARYVVIGVLTGVVVFFLFSKPHKHRRDYGPVRMAATPLLALLYAVPGCAAGGLIVWQLPWLARHGLAAPQSWGPLANEVNGYIASGHLALLLLGLAGSWLFARYASLGPADEMQWFFAERKAAAIMGAGRARSRAGAVAGAITGKIPVIGTPGYRVRVRALVAAGAPLRERGTWMVVLLSEGLPLMLILAGYGAWLTLAGPAAGA